MVSTVTGTAAAGGIRMLEFERTVPVPGGDAAVNVFVDEEKGHVVYLSHTGTLVVVDEGKVRDGRTRAAGFVVADSGCQGCDGC